MRTIWILTACFIVLLLAPIVFAAIYYKKRKGQILHINQNKVRDARFFGKSFSSMVRNNLATAADGKILLSREEEFLDADTAEEYEEAEKKMVIARTRPFCPPEEVRVFEKEIYSAQDAALLNQKTELRALYCEKKAVIGNDVTIDRWVDSADTLAIYDNCNLGISVSAANALSVGHNCIFRRMYAPVIRIGQYPDSDLTPEAGKDPRIYYLPVQMNKENNVRYINKERINEEGIVDFSVISPHKVTVTEGLIVQGDIRSHKNVRLCDDAVVCGNIFAEGDIWLGRNATVLGNMFSQGSIYFEERASAGQRGKICSVIAREDITFERDNFVFGYVSCERNGTTLELPKEEQDETKLPDYRTLDTPVGLKHLTFNSLYDFEHVDWQGYRKEKELEDVLIPAGAAMIQKSMFFDCRVLREAVLPDTVEVVDDYAFADCFELKEIGDFSRMPLTRIGTSAFENCRLLRRADFPAGLKVLGGAAFAGCTSLRSVTFPEDSELVQVGPHCFRGCPITELWFPDTLEFVGVSAFMDCAELRRVSVPETCAEQEGIKDLLERGVEVELRPVPEKEEEERAEDA